MPPYQSPVHVKRKLDSRNSFANKRTKTDNPFDYSSEAFRRWRTRRLKESAADAFAATTIRAEAHKLKRLPLEIRRMIYAELYRPAHGNIKVYVEADKPKEPPVFHAAGTALEGTHYLNPKYVGDHVAADAVEALYESSCFEVELSDLASFLQPRQLLPGVKPAAFIRSLVVRMEGDRPYTGWGKDNDMINASDWIDLSKPMPIREDELDDQPNPVVPFKIPRPSDRSKRAWKWRQNRDLLRAERAGLNLLCRMPRLRVLEVEVRCKAQSGPELRPLIPAMHRLREKGLTASVSCYTVTTYGSCFLVDITQLFSVPLPGDLEFAAGHALIKHKDCVSGPDPYYSYRRWDDKPWNWFRLHKCSDFHCVRVEFNKLWEELKERATSYQTLNGDHVGAKPGVVDREYGSSPPPEAQEWARTVEETHAAKSRPMGDTDGVQFTRSL